MSKSTTSISNAALSKKESGNTGRLIIVSNRLPYRCTFSSQVDYALEKSTGGLVSGLAPLHKKSGNLWIGWADLPSNTNTKEQSSAKAAFRKHACCPVFLDTQDAELYYEGFSNSTIWPLFHGFTQHARFKEEEWLAYVRVNKHFCDVVCAKARPGDTVWIQDYHLMLLPALLQEAAPDINIGFFMHVPFPDYETFRMIPWRKELLQGMLGADLLGFHASNYEENFLSNCYRIAHVSSSNNALSINNHRVQTGVFPLGIDYHRFYQATLSPNICQHAQQLISYKESQQCKTMLSVERLDYAKGIPERILAFNALLEQFPEWQQRVTLTLVTVPSRENITSYRMLKKHIDELVGWINGKYATATWTPIEYFYRSFSFDQLVALYMASDVMLVTPLKDGMNLVCKEYLACHDNRSGVLVLSEMAGAACELNEALIVNPFDTLTTANTMHQALTMPEAEQIRRNKTMQEKLALNTSQKWAHAFLNALQDTKNRQAL